VEDPENEQGDWQSQDQNAGERVSELVVGLESQKVLESGAIVPTTKAEVTRRARRNGSAAAA